MSSVQSWGAELKVSCNKQFFLISLTSPRDKYQVFDSAPRGLLRVEELEDQGQSLANVFILRLLENADDREASYMLKASSQ